MNDFLAEPFLSDDDPFEEQTSKTIGNVTYHKNVEQGSDEWFQLRLGVLTASEVKHLVTPTLKAANNDKTRQHIYELAAQRISKFIEPTYVGDAMLRGHTDEFEAKIIYNAEIAPVTEVGFLTNSKWGFTIGYSPDGLVGEDGLLECKSRIQKYQIQTITEHVHDDKNNSIPAEFVMQVQTGLLVSERKWIDFISYSGGLPMVVIRVYPDPEIQAAILSAAEVAETKIKERIQAYQDGLKALGTRAFPTERRIEEEMFV